MRAPSGDAARLQTARLALRWLGCLACCLMVLVTSSARALPRFPSVEVVRAPMNLPGIMDSIQPSMVGLRLADLDRDRDLDMVATVFAFGNGYLVTWFNQGDGTFTFGEAVAYPADYLDSIDTADLDLDGDVDVVLDTGASARAYLNDGSGKLAKFGFAYPLTDSGAVSVTIADVDRDHFPDLLTVSVDITEPGELRVFLNRHDGSFGLPSTRGDLLARPNVVMPMPTFTQSSSSVVAQDLNADGLVDLVVDDARHERLLYFEANGVASWNSRPTILAAGYFPISALASDVDLDGDSDLLAVDRVLGTLVVLKNDGGEFSAPVLAPPLFADALGMADLNNDCFPDAFAANGPAGYVSVMLNRGNGSFAEPINYSFASLINDFQAGDIDGDGDVDLVTSGGATPEGVTPKPGYLSIARNLGTGEFWVPKAYEVPQVSALASGDFDADGRADFVVGAAVLLGSSDRGYEAIRALDDTTSVNCSGCGAEVADLNADGLSDVVQHGREVAAFISNGDGTFDKSWTLATSYPSDYLSLGQLNKDTLWDFIDQEAGVFNVEFFGATSTTFAQGPTVTWDSSTFSGGFLPKLADLNGDGADELLVLNFAFNGLGVGINNGDGSSFNKTNYALGAAPQGIDVADYTGDGKLDAVVSVDTGSLLVYPGKGDGSLLAPQAYPVAAPGRIASADFDGDGDVDLLVASQDYANSIVYVENVGSGVFSKTVVLLNAVGPSKLVTADLEGDGDPDFAALNEPYTLTTFENRQLTEDPAKSHPLLCDACPEDELKTVPGVCGCGVADADTDDDGVVDCKDACPEDASKRQIGICGCGVSDRDTDGDGKADCVDACPQDPHKTVVGICGCGAVDVDTDHDGTVDCRDDCPLDIAKVAPGTCGCGVADGDSDGDDTVDCVDTCPDDPAKTSPGLCGCGAVDDDADQDGTADCSDGCRLDPLKKRAGVCGCGMADTDTDADGWPDCVDECPSTPGTCASSGGESAGGSAGVGGGRPSSGGTAGARPNESETAGAGHGGGSQPSMGVGGDDRRPSAAGGSGEAPQQSFMRPTGTQILPEQHASGCDCSTASSSGASPLGLLSLSLLVLRQRRRAARKGVAPTH